MCEPCHDKNEKEVAKRAQRSPASKNKKTRSVASRYRAVQYLAERMFFDLEKHGDRYSLSRKLGGFTPQRNLTLNEVEKVLELWKLQGPHGG
jgi:hypothetical protein